MFSPSWVMSSGHDFYEMALGLYWAYLKVLGNLCMAPIIKKKNNKN